MKGKISGQIKLKVVELENPTKNKYTTGYTAFDHVIKLIIYKHYDKVLIEYITKLLGDFFYD